MTQTPHLNLPYIAAAQSQKHVTHNEALRALDALVQLVVLDRHLSVPPASPNEGDRYIVAVAPSGAWAGHANEIAAWQDGAWAFHIAPEGWLAWVADENTLYVFDGTAWAFLANGAAGANLTIANRTASTLDVASDSGTDATVPAATTALSGLMTGDDKAKLDGIAAGADVTPAALQSRTMVGINATADATNRLSVSSPAALFNHEGAGHQVKINKNAAADTASFLFQTGFSGRAEMGTTGDDNFHFKVSADGAAWTEAMVIDKTTGLVTLTNNSVTNAALADMPTARLKGRATAGAGDPEDLTAAQATALLDPFTSALKGVAPASGGGTTNFLRADGTWAAPAGGGGGEANTASNVGTAGVGVFKVKSGVDLQFKKLNAGSAKITITDDTGNDEVDIDVAEASLTLANLGGSIDLGGSKASGTLAAARFPALTGDVTTTAGALAATIADDAVTNAKLANVATATLKGRATAGTGDPEDLTATQAKSVLAIAAGDVSGLAASATTDTTNASNIGSGTLGSARLPAFGSGDVSFAAAGGAGTVAGNAVTNAKLADVATATFKGRTTAGTGDPEDLTVAQAKTLLNLAGTNSGDQTITLTGDVTGSGTGSFAATVANDAVTNAKLANVATATLKGRTTAGTGDPEDLTATQATALLNSLVGDAGSGGTKGLAPAPASGDAAAGRFLHANGTWALPPGAGGGEANTASNVGTAGVGVFKQKTGIDLEFKKINAGSAAISITDDTGNSEVDIDVADDGIGNAKLANVATATIKGRATAGTGDPEDLTGSQATALLDAFTSTLKGLAPASGGGTSNFLRADGTWAAPAGGGGGSVATDTIFDAKGDLPVGTGADTAARLAASASNGRILVTDSGQTTGLKWKIADETIVPISTAYYTPRITGTAALTLTTTRKHFVPVFLPAGTYTKAALRISTTVASTSVRLGVYNWNKSTGLPSTLLSGGDIGTVDMSTGTLKTVTGLSLVVPEDGWYLMACHASGAPQIRGTSTTAHPTVHFGCDFINISYGITALFRDTAFGAMAADETGNTFTNVYNGTGLPIFGVAP